MKRILFGLALLLLAAGQPLPAYADEEADALVRQLFEVMQLDQNRSLLLEGRRFDMAAAAERWLISRKIPTRERNELLAMYRRELKSALDELETSLDRHLVASYAERFSEEELEKLIEIFKSPIIAKYNKVSGEAFDQNAVLMNTRTEALQTRMTELMLTWLEQRGVR